MKILGNEIAPVGMGCWAIGGPFYSGEQPLGFGNVDDTESTKTIHAALDAGIRLFDTAAVYGAGHSERLLGSALKGRPDALVISKLGVLFDEQSKQVLGSDASGETVSEAIDASLRRLQRDRIDIMLLHLNALSIEEATSTFEQMDKARKAGKLQAFGWSTDFPASAAALSTMDGFVAVEHAMNLFVDVPSMQSTLEQHQLHALIRSPLAMGLLTGKFNQDSIIQSDDVRSSYADWQDYFHQGKAAGKYLDRLGAVRELLRSDGRTLAQGALSWLLAKSANNIPLPGARTVAQVQENAATIAFGPLRDEIMQEIESLIDREPEGEPRQR